MLNNTSDQQERWTYAGFLALATGAFIVFMSFVFLLFTGSTTQLACQVNGVQSVDCTVLSSWFGLFTYGKQTLQEVHRAEVGEHCDEGGDCTYRVELLTAQNSRVPLTAFYSSGKADKLIAVDQLNAFLAQPGTDRLTNRISSTSGQLLSALLSILSGLTGGWLIRCGVLLRRRARTVT